MYQLVSILAVAALTSLQYGVLAAKLPRAHLINTMDNEISINEPIPPSHGRRNFLEWDVKPEPAWQRAGAVARLACGAIGSPTPHVQWLKNDMPILEDEPENNEIVEVSQASLARVRGDLLVRTVSARAQDLYTCVVTAGAKSIEASAVVYNEGSIPAHAVRAVNRRLLAAPAKPTVTHHVTTLLDDIGASVLLPCRASGQPAPDLYWYDNRNRTVLGDEPRIRVLESGELLISEVRWEDMGGYTCTAKNTYGKESVTTFLYPVRTK